MFRQACFSLSLSKLVDSISKSRHADWSMFEIIFSTLYDILTVEHSYKQARKSRILYTYISVG